MNLAQSRHQSTQLQQRRHPLQYLHMRKPNFLSSAPSKGGATLINSNLVYSGKSIVLTTRNIVEIISTALYPFPHNSLSVSNPSSILPFSQSRNNVWIAIG